MSPTLGQVTHVLLTRSPLSLQIVTPKGSDKQTPFDLHVLGAPPAFVLSQDQTLHKMVFKPDYSELNRCNFSDTIRLHPRITCILELFNVIFHHDKVPFKLRYCSIFKVLCRSPSRDSLFIISHQVLVVKHFFEIFFQALPSGLPSLTAQL